MIYSEKIETDSGHTAIERQKNGVDKEWYGTDMLYKDANGEEQCADNETFLIKTLLPLLNSKDYVEAKKYFKDELVTIKLFKQMRKVLKKADELGWFEGIK